MRLGEEWRKRSFLGDILVPSLLESRQGLQRRVIRFPALTGNQILDLYNPDRFMLPF